jgi:protein-disulfide isomerase
VRYKTGVSAARTPSSPSASARRARTRLYQLGALLVSVVAIAAVLIAVLSSGSTSDLKPGRPVPGAPRTLALFAGIPQHGIALGNPHAPVTLVEFGDLQCPACAQFAQQTLPSIVSRYVRGGRVLLVFRGLDFIGSDSRRAARMSGAVGLQDRMFQFNELMYANQGAENSGYVTDIYLRALAGAIPGVDVTRALAARDSAAVRVQLREAQALARRLNLKSTPSFLLYRSAAAPRRFEPPNLNAGSFGDAIERLLASGEG